MICHSPLFKVNVTLMIGSFLAVAGFPAAAFSSTQFAQSSSLLSYFVAALVSPWMVGCAIASLVLLLIHASFESNLVKPFVSKDHLS